jgi:hypothetical protein
MDYFRALAAVGITGLYLVMAKPFLPLADFGQGWEKSL